MKYRYASGAALAALLFFSCEKDNPAPAGPAFTLTVNNEFDLLAGRHAVYLSDAAGKVLAYREIPGNDTAQLQLAEARPGDRYDCTLVRITTLLAPGSGIKDTSITLTTYTGLATGETVNLRDPNFQQVTDLTVAFTGVTSVDTIIVPEGLTFARPQPSNNFTGQYRVLHTGRVWLRAQVNGEHKWRFILFNNVSGPAWNTSVTPDLLLPIFVAPTKITFPFTAAWQYKVDGVIDSARLQFVAMGDLLRAPGGPVPVFSSIEIYEPVSNDVFDPMPRPYDYCRVRMNGTDDTPGGYAYSADFFYDGIPATLPVPAFDLSPTVLSDNRLVATQCAGDFDALVFSRTRAGTPNITWEVYTPPATGIVSYRLPDVPAELGSQFPVLKNYDFGGQVRARAESYERLSDYDAIIRLRLLNNDPIWQAKAGYLGREEVQ